MLIADAIPNPTFANHESFHLRYGWLKKAYDAVDGNSGDIFVQSDAPIKLGVGKNMVKAIRFWALSNKIVQLKGNAKSTLEPTEMGHAIFRSSGGLDPYLEKSETLWLLHWLLFAPPCRIPVWWLIMNEFAATNIKLGELTDSVTQRITNISEWNTPSAKSIKKDVDVFMHTYSTERGKLSIEDYLDCPFRQMRMIRQNSDMMRFVFGKKYGMSPMITAFACLDFVRRLNITSKSISVSRLATEVGSVGNIFKIGEHDLADMLAEASNTSKVIHMENVNGAQHLVFRDAELAAETILGDTYGKSGFKIPKTKHMVVPPSK